MDENKKNAQEEFVVEKQDVSGEELENVAGGAECAYMRKCPECGKMCKSYNDKMDHLVIVHGRKPHVTNS